jgi:hypothetical protein
MVRLADKPRQDLATVLYCKINKRCPSCIGLAKQTHLGSWNLLQYFRFGFEFAEIFDCILSMRTDSSAYSQSVSSFTLRIQQIRTTKTSQRFIPYILTILYVRTDSFRVFSVYIHTIEV